MFQYIFSFIVVVLCLTKEAHQVKLRVCEGTTEVINCQSNEIIAIQDASWGRSISTICPSNVYDSTTTCYKDVTSKMASYCYGKQSCTIAANNSAFGEPCKYVYKYLEVSYTCVRKVNTTRACEDREIQITCPPYYQVIINSAFYGRLDDGICSSSSIPKEPCYKDVTSALFSTCYLQQSCRLLVSNIILGPDPCQGTSKYAEVNYYCY